MISRCLASIYRDNADTACDVVLVDNASGDGVIDRMREEFPAVRVVEMDGNPGFAAAVNRGLAEVDAPMVLMLNTDAVLTRGSLASMAASLESAGENVAGVAPKMMSSSHGGVIDAVGIVIPPTGAAFNRGIGQCDLGQYDTPEEVAGVCFGAGLLRRGLFNPDRVGLLYEDYFLYFEDSDWCMRALSQGYRFLTAPETVVLHMHSGITREESLDFKYGLIELNTLKMVTRNFESAALAARIVTARCLRLLARTFIRRKFIGPNLKTIAAYLGGLPRLLRERRALRADRRSGDGRVFAMAAGEDAYFDTVAYQPDRCLESLIDTYQRLQKKSGDRATAPLLEALISARREAAQGQATAVSDELLERFEGQPECVRELLRTCRRRQRQDAGAGA